MHSFIQYIYPFEITRASGYTIVWVGVVGTIASFTMSKRIALTFPPHRFRSHYMLDTQKVDVISAVFVACIWHTRVILGVDIPPTQLVTTQRFIVLNQPKRSTLLSSILCLKQQHQRHSIKKVHYFVLHYDSQT